MGEQASGRRPAIDIGQRVRRVGGQDVGVVVGVLLGGVERSIVRWSDHTSFETTDDLVVADGPST